MRSVVVLTFTAGTHGRVGVTVRVGHAFDAQPTPDVTDVFIAALVGAVLVRAAFDAAPRGLVADRQVISPAVEVGSALDAHSQHALVGACTNRRARARFTSSARAARSDTLAELRMADQAALATFLGSTR